MSITESFANLESAVIQTITAIRTDIQHVQDTKLDTEETAQNSEQLGGVGAAEYLKRTEVLDCGDL